MKRINWDIIIEWGLFFWVGFLTGLLIEHFILK